MVINYKKMNEATIGDAHKLPRKDSILEKSKEQLGFHLLMQNQDIGNFV